MGKWVKIALAVVTVILLIGIGIGIYGYISVKETVNSMYEPLPKRKEIVLNPSQRPNLSNKEPTSKDEANKESVDVSTTDLKPISLLVMGVDESEHDKGRADTLMLITINPQQQKVLMTSIPRDTRVKIAGKDKIDKINHSYAFGGTAMAVETVEDFLGVPIQYYVKTNMEGFTRIVDKFGGVKVNNEFRFDLDGFVFEQGEQVLNGQEALAYVRMRKEDPNGDLGRTMRQQDVLVSLFESVKDISNIAELPGVLDIMKQVVKTNLTWDEMKTLFMEYKPQHYSFIHESIHGEGQMIDHIYYLKVDQEEIERVHQQIAEQLS
ncbi:LCP family glycopolymer transferase [Paenibacillus marinisediminis]